MRKYIYIVLLSCVAFTACKQKENTTAVKDGYLLQGTLTNAPDASLAILSYQQNDSTIVDTAMVKEGKFSFTGKVKNPSEAAIRLRHGEKFPEKNWLSDTYNFFIDNNTMELSATDSIKNATLKGSELTDQSIAITNKITPLTNEILALFKRMKDRSKADKLITYDTIQVYVDSIRGVAHKFIMSHPGSYVALKRFLQHEMPKNFDPEVADKEFNELFNQKLQETPTGKKIAEMIAVAKKSVIGKKAMDFTQTTIDGKEFKLSSLRGKYVLVDFWASWCKPCRAENPNVVKAYQKYKNKNFEIVGVSLDASKKQWKNAIEKDGLPWIHVSDLKYWKNEVAQQYGIKSVPSNFLINPDGVIIAKNLRGEALANRLSEIFDKGKL